MLNFVQTRFNSMRSTDLMPGSAITEEGMCLALVRHMGTTVCRESQGTAKETFGGFSLETTLRPEILPRIETVTVSAEGKHTLGRPFISGQIALVLADGSVVTAFEDKEDKPADATTVSFQGEDLIFADELIGTTVTVQYLYEPTIAEARSIQGEGNGYTHMQPSVEVGKISRIVGGIVSTNQFDIMANWNDDSVIHPSMGAGGKLTVGGSGTLVTEVVIMEAPTGDNGFLTVEYTKG